MGEGTARSVSLDITLNGLPMAGALAAEVSSNAYFGAGRFEARFALDPAASWLVSLARTDVLEIGVFLSGVRTSLITGCADSLSFDPVRGIGRVSGRDLSSRFVDAPLNAAYQNQTSSEIVTALCAARGLVPVVTTTTTPVGRFFDNQHARTALNQFARASTEWDLFVWLAGLEKFDLWVNGETLYFAPTDFADGSPALLDASDCLSLEVEKSLPLASGLNVSVKSWNSFEQRSIAQTSNLDGASDYVVVRPNLDTDAAQELAASLSAAASAQAVCVRAEMPGDAVMAPRLPLAIRGTGLEFDGPYVITEVERSLSVERGFSQVIEARSAGLWMPS